MSSPVRLEKKSEMGNVESFLLGHANIIVPVLILILLVLFVCLAYAIVGVSAVESGNYYNHFAEVI